MSNNLLLTPLLADDSPLDAHSREVVAALHTREAEAALSLPTDDPLDPKRRLELGFVQARLGDKEAAIVNGRRATEMRPESKDAFDGPQFVVGLAQIYALTGEADQAVALLRRSLSTPHGVTVAMLQIDPVWDGLRADPRFAELLALKATQA